MPPIFEFYRRCFYDDDDDRFLIKDSKVYHKFRDIYFEVFFPSAVGQQIDPGLFFCGGSCDETLLMEKVWNIKEGDVVVDIGAHIGTWTLPALKLGASHVYCFEPYPPAYHMLLKNLELNDFKNVCVINKALHHEESYTWIGFEAGSYKSPQMMAHCVPLDDYIFDRIDWMKIDVEGTEISVLTGARKTLEKHRPRIVLEFHTNELLCHIRDVRYLLPTGYSIYTVDKHHIIIPDMLSKGWEDVRLPV